MNRGSGQNRFCYRCFLLTLALLVAVFLAQPEPSLAHPQFALRTINRYSKWVLLQDGQVRLTYVFMVGDVPAFALRKEADHNQDGKLSEQEGRTLALGFLALAERGLSVELDGVKVPLHFEEPVLGLAGDAVLPSAFSVDLVANLRVPNPALEDHNLRYEDEARKDPVGEVEILIEEGPSVKVHSSYVGRGQGANTTIQLRHRFDGPKTSSLSDRSVHVQFRLPLAGKPPSLGNQESVNPARGRTYFLLVGLSLLALCASALCYRFLKRS